MLPSKPLTVRLRHNVCYGKLQSELGGLALAERLRHKEVQLVGKAHARFVDQVRTDGPHIGDRGVVAAHIAAVAVKWADTLVHGLPRVVALRLGKCQPVGWGHVIVRAAKPLDEGVGAGRLVREIVLVVPLPLATPAILGAGNSF